MSKIDTKFSSLARSGTYLASIILLTLAVLPKAQAFGVGSVGIEGGVHILNGPQKEFSTLTESLPDRYFKNSVSDAFYGEIPECDSCTTYIGPIDSRASAGADLFAGKLHAYAYGNQFFYPPANNYFLSPALTWSRLGDVIHIQFKDDPTYTGPLDFLMNFRIHGNTWRYVNSYPYSDGGAQAWSDAFVSWQSELIGGYQGVFSFRYTDVAGEGKNITTISGAIISYVNDMVTARVYVPRFSFYDSKGIPIYAFHLFMSLNTHVVGGEADYGHTSSVDIILPEGWSFTSESGVFLTQKDDPPIVNGPPVAHAGTNQSIQAGQTVYLNGTGSFDDHTPSQDLHYTWRFVSQPTGSTAMLTGANTATPWFIADKEGDYVVSLTVTDAGGLSSVPAEVIISSRNTPPNAAAGSDRIAIIGNLVTLDGSASNDPDNHLLSFAWTWLDKPTDSSAALNDAGTATPSFVPDRTGNYELQLIVNDGFADSTPDTVTVLAITGQQHAEQRIMEALNRVTALPSRAVTTPGNQTALKQFLMQAVSAIQEGDLSEALKKLQSASERTDGCALRGSPDPAGGKGSNPPAQDYINNCADQQQVYPLLQEALSTLDT